MINFIERLHQKPEHHRRAMALSVSLIITLMVFGIWVSLLPARFSIVDGVAKETQKQLEDGITPLATVKASFDEAADSIKELKAGFEQGATTEIQTQQTPTDIGVNAETVTGD